MNTAITAFQQKDSLAQEQQRQADLAVAQQWFNTTVRLTWRSSQRPRQQFENSLADRETLQAIKETRIRMVIINKEINLITQRIPSIKVML